MKRLLTGILMLFSVMVTQAQQVYHTVQRGETLESIARKYNVTTDAIKRTNPDAAKMIYVGMKLIIPSFQQSRNKGSIQDNSSKSNSSNSKKIPEDKILNNTQTKISPIVIGNKEVYFGILVEAFGGYSNFMWKDGSPVAGIGFGAGVTGQLHFHERDFVPDRYFAQIGINYARKGSGAYPINYINAKVLPLGYSFCNLINDFALFVKAGGYVAYPFSKISTNNKSFNTKLDYGAIGCVGVSYEKFSVGVSYEHGFADVCDTDVSLKNQNIFLILSYRIF